MPIAQVRNASMQEIGSTDHLKTDNKNFGAEWYDSAGGTTFIDAVTVPLAGEKINTAPTVFSMDSGVLTVTEAGLYLFNFSVTVNNSGSDEMIFQAFLQEDPATGTFATVIGTSTYGTLFAGNGSVFNSSLVRAGISYRYRIRASRHGGVVSSQLLQNGSKLSVVRLFKNG